MKSILTEVEIESSAARAWHVLTTFSEHSSWNPYITSISGQLRGGAQLRAVLRLEGLKDQVVKPKILVVEKEKELRWKGKFPLGMYWGEHRWILEEKNGGKKVKVVHGEEFGGWARGLINWWLGDRVEKGFKAMNEAMKRKCEDGS